MPIYASHRSKEFFAGANVFRPERFLKSETSPEGKSIKLYAFRPFGGG